MNEGYIKLFRQLQENKYYCKPNYLAIWIDILLNVSHTKRERIFRGDRILLEVGEGLFFQKELSNKFKIPLTTVNRVLKSFKSGGQVEIKTNQNYTIIKVLNWVRFQETETKRKPNGNQTETPKEGKEGKEYYSISDFSENSIPYFILKGFLKLGYKPKGKKEEFENWCTDLCKLNGYRFSDDIKKIIDEWVLYWKSNGKVIKNHKTCLLNSPLLAVNKKKYEKK